MPGDDPGAIGQWVAVRFTVGRDRGCLPYRWCVSVGHPVARVLLSQTRRRRGLAGVPVARVLIARAGSGRSPR